MTTLLPQWRKDLITNNLTNLIEEIDVEDGLFEKLIKKGVLKKSVVRRFRRNDQNITDRQVRELLEFISRGSNEKYDAFCDVLIEEDQGMIVENYLRPKHLNENQNGGPMGDSSAIPVQDSNESSEVTSTAANNLAQGEAGTPKELNKPSGERSDNMVQTAAALKRKISEEEEMPLKKHKAEDESEDEEIELDDDDCNGENEIHVLPATPKFYEEHKKDAYPMYKMKRGKVLIINVNKVQGSEPRHGTKYDRDSLKQLFTQLHFDVKIYDDADGLRAQDIHKKVLAFASPKEHSSSQCVIMCILSHGTYMSGKDCIYGTDGRLVAVDELLKCFSNTSRPELEAMPKLFFIQACRGSKADEGSMVDGNEDENDDLVQRPSVSNILIARPTQQGYKSWRRRNQGSWFIQAVCKVFQTYAATKDICAMLNIVNGVISRKVSSSLHCEKDQKSQMSKYDSMLTKAHLYFFPGIHKH